jgi:hypothetical protein
MKDMEMDVNIAALKKLKKITINQSTFVPKSEKLCLVLPF